MASLMLKSYVFSYGDEQILHQASLDISKGELVTILGPNGCG